jgi:hypothetical protein
MGRKRKPDAKLQQSIGGDIYRVTVYMSKKMKDAFLCRVAKEGKTQSFVIAEALEDYLRK